MNGFEAFGPVQQVADAVLYEGYLLYPYRASAGKNAVRWQWGVLMPPGYVEVDPSERSSSQTDCLLEGTEPRLRIRIRFLQVQRRTVEARTANGFREVAELGHGEITYRPWDEAVERHVDVELTVADLPTKVPFEIPGGTDDEQVGDLGRLVRRREPLTGTLRASGVVLPGPYGLRQLRLQVQNTTVAESNQRSEALRYAMVAQHLMVAAEDGTFLSLLDPPEWAGRYVAECENDGTFPVLAAEPGRADVMLSSPIILYDHPQVAPESPADLFDATEIDEILSLRTMTLTDEEKREVRGTDPRGAELLAHVDNMPPELMDRLHGTIRYLRAATAPEPPPADTPWWDPGNDTSVSPETDTVTIAGVAVGNGSRVRLRPGHRRADAQDMFLAGRTATVAAVLADVDGATHVAVTLDDEWGDLQRAHGRYLYFSPDELEPVVTP
jgi:hypothetical protein